jgi:hypothetical protein
MQTQWTPAQCEQLRQLWLAGRSATDIGTTLGFSRGAILGKLSRLGLMGRGGTLRKDSAPDSAPVRRIPF